MDKVVGMKRVFQLFLFALSTMYTFAQTRVDEIRTMLLSRDTSSVIVVAHRADWRNFPENSLEGIESAIQMGVDIVELDVQMTKDSVLILMHDKSLNRTTTGRGNIADVDWEYVSSLKLRNGCGVATDQRVPTLEQALLLCKDRVMINLDKADRYFDKVYKLLKETGTTNLIIMKGSKSALQVQEQYGKYLDDILYMPIVNIDRPNSIDVIHDHIRVRTPIAFELCFATDTCEHINRLKDILNGSSLIWINTLWASLCAGHHDDVSLYDIDNGYSYVIDVLGANIIQTDRPLLLLEYLRSRNLHK